MNTINAHDNKIHSHQAILNAEIYIWFPQRYIYKKEDDVSKVPMREMQNSSHSLRQEI